MRANEIEVGKTYLAKVSGRVVPVKVLAKRFDCDLLGREKSRWECRNETTGREIVVKSCQRFRSEVKPERIETCQPN